MQPTATARTAAQEPARPQEPVVVTVGEATVRRPPDRALVTISVETRAKSPRDAQRLNAEAMTAVQQRLAQARLGSDAIRTTGYNIQQEFDFVQGKRVPREHFGVFAGEANVGEVTSGTFSPTLDLPIAMAYVAPASSAIGTELMIDIRGRREPARVVELPFYK